MAAHDTHLNPLEQAAFAVFRAQLSAAGVRHLTADSREANPTTAFVAYPGRSQDGRSFIAQAIAAGAPAIIAEAGPPSLGVVAPRASTALQFQLPRLSARVSHLASEFYGDPSAQITMVGITGTNGKTSTAHWVATALAQLNAGVNVSAAAVAPVALFGTLGNGLYGPTSAPQALTQANNTTPDAIVLQRLLAQFAAQGARTGVMEVSSHGLDQGRVAAVHFKVGVFTNLTRDHLDYHGTLAAYGAAKALLFTDFALATAVINEDDALGVQLLNASMAKQAISYGVTSGDLRAQSIELTPKGIRFTVNGKYGRATIAAPVVGLFNVHNLLAALGALLGCGVSLDHAAQALSTVVPPAGRMNLIASKPTAPSVVVDYAHTPDALEKVLLSLRASLTEGQRLICVFGCGGDRDPGKRPIMGAISARLADFSIVTSDNPRSESPQLIIDQITAGMAGASFVECADRQLAIAQAIQMAQPGDWVLLAGKGHEDYQEIQGIKHAFDDRLVAQQCLGVAA